MQQKSYGTFHGVQEQENVSYLQVDTAGSNNESTGGLNTQLFADKSNGMMSLRAWIALLFFYLIYLIIGGFTFQAIESPHDCESQKKEFNISYRINLSIEKFRDNLNDDERADFDDLWNKIKDVESDHPVFQYNNVSTGSGNQTHCDSSKLRWTYYNSLFFSFTAITTIGYGHIYPMTQLGKVVCILYSLLGVPINGILIGALGAYFRNKIKKFETKLQASDTALTRVLVVGAQVIVYCLLGFIVFIFLPAIVFSSIEDSWDYLDSTYMAFITLTTIGFGDYVPGKDQAVLNGLGEWGQHFYEIGVVTWIIFGLGYLFMIIQIISEGLRAPAKRVVKKMRKLTKAEKSVLSKIFHELIKSKQQQEDERLRDQENLPKGSTVASSMNSVGNTSASTTDRIDGIGLPPPLVGQNSTIFGFENEAYNSSPMRKEIQPSPSTEDIIEELNHDTITSLRNFVESAHYLKRRVTSATSAHRNGATSSRSSSFSSTTQRSEPLPSSYNGGRSRSSSIQGFDQQSTSTVQPQKTVSLHGGDESNNDVGKENRLWKSLWPRKLSYKSVDNDTTNLATSANLPRSSSTTRKSSVSLPEILQQTTLQEFLEVIERVQATEVLSENYDGKHLITEDMFTSNQEESEEEDMN